jgi:Tol biopolymer transport system component
MTISAGTRLGPYEIVTPIGAGGMGEVYKARDTRLDRSVAVKILPAELAQNAQFKMRFEREARTISQLSHPNICTLYDVGDNYLVMELLDGETLADRLAKGPLPLADLLKYGTQIAEALGKAHREGVVHRDLKPGNIMITKSGAKLLDFGLAKSVVDAAVTEATQQKPLTQEGTLLGTFQYMAPEQLAGEEPDARTDIFALGAVLYEMATGKRAFEGKTKTSLIAAIVSGDPKPIASLQPTTPPALEHVIRKCLAKERDDRWQSASDIAEELRWTAEERPAAQLRRSAVWPIVGVAAVLSLVLGALIGSWSVTRNRPAPPLTYTEIDAPEGTTFAFDAATAAISPDGKTIAMVAKGKDGGGALWLRPLDSPGAHMLRGTDNPTFPFWSPDSKYLGFFADGKLKRIEINSGLPETIAEAGTARGGCWSANGMILFSPTPASPIYGIPASGGEARPITELDIKRGDTSHRFPTFLPDGRHFLFFVQGASESNVLVGSIDSKESRGVTSAQAAVLFAPPDYVLFVREGALRAQHFDLKNMKLVGESVSIADHVQASGSLNFANVSVSMNGILTFVTGGSATISELTIVDRSGKDLGTIGTAYEQLDVSVAPDGHAVALSRYDMSGASDVWVFDLRRDLQTRQTFSPANEFGPLWSPDGKTIVFSSFDKRPGDLFVKRVDSSGPGDVLFADRRRKIASCWSRDGNYIIYQALTPGTQWDIEAWSLRDRKVIPLVNTPASEMHGQLSPDSRWLAYASSESGRMEVFVRPFLNGRGEHWQISGGGGSMPRWSADGKELFYVSPDGKLMAATIHGGETFSADGPRPLFQTRLRLLNGITRMQYDILPDGRFLMNEAIAGSEKQSLITVVQNWTRKLPAQ